MTVRALRFTEVSTLNPLDIEPVLDIHIGLRRRLHRYGKLKQDLDRMARSQGGAIDEIEMERMKERIELQFHDTEENELRGTCLHHVSYFSTVPCWLCADSGIAVLQLGVWDDMVDDSGAVSLEEFKRGLENLGIRVNQGMLSDFFESLDQSGTGKIHFEDFEAWWLKNENTMRATTHNHTATDSIRETQRRVTTVEKAVGELQEDMAKLLSALRTK